MSDMTRERIRLGPWPYPLTEERANAVALYKAELLAAGRTFLEITGNDCYEMIVPVNQPTRTTTAPFAVETK